MRPKHHSLFHAVVTSVDDCTRSEKLTAACSLAAAGDVLQPVVSFSLCKHQHCNGTNTLSLFKSLTLRHDMHQSRVTSLPALQVLEGLQQNAVSPKRFPAAGACPTCLAKQNGPAIFAHRHLQQLQTTLMLCPSAPLSLMALPETQMYESLGTLQQ